MGKVIAVCTSDIKGVQKRDVGKVTLVAGHGIKGDAHAGNWHRQVSLLSDDKVEAFRERGAVVDSGAFGENIVVDGVDFASLPVGTRFRCGNVWLELTQIGKECHSHCAIYEAVGDCIMPREGVFTRVLSGGEISVGDELEIVPENEKTPLRAAIITASDKGYEGGREDVSGGVIREICAENGYLVSYYAILPDDRQMLADEMKRLCDSGAAELILTTGGTGFSPRDWTPEATLDIAERTAPGIAEAMRYYSLQITPRAMLSRAVAAMRGKTLIVNLPGSPKAVRESLDAVISSLRHGIEIMIGDTGECAR